METLRTMFYRLLCGLPADRARKAPEAALDRCGRHVLVSGIPLTHLTGHLGFHDILGEC